MEVSLPDVDQRDELGDLADAFEDIHDSMTVSPQVAKVIDDRLDAVTIKRPSIDPVSLPPSRSVTDAGSSTRNGDGRG